MRPPFDPPVGISARLPRAQGGAPGSAGRHIGFAWFGAVLWTAVSVAPATSVGFLADDWFLGAMAQASWDGSGSWPERVESLFAPAWSGHYQLTRPLSLLAWHAETVWLTPSPKRAHLISAGLWCVLAGLVGLLGARLSGNRCLGPATAALFGSWPAATEAVGWIAARTDIMLAIFVMLAVLESTANRPRAWVLAGITVLALGTKESAVALPVILLPLEWGLHHRSFSSGNRRVRLRYSITSVIVGLYLLLRWRIWGTPFGSYQGLSLFDGAGSVVHKLGITLGRLFLPISAEERFGSGLSLLACCLATGLACGAAVLLPWRRCASLLPLVLIPTALALPVLDPVTASLERGRLLVLPAAGLAILASGALLAPARGLRRGALAACLLWYVVGMVGWRINLSPWIEATHRTERILQSLLSGGTDPEWVLAVGLEPPEEPGGMWQELRRCRGAHALSDGLFYATRSPFRRPPIRVEPLRRADYTDARAKILGTDLDRRPRVVRWVQEDLSFRTVVPGSSAVPLPMFPVGPVSSQWDGALTFALPPNLDPTTRFQVCLALPSGERAESPLIDVGSNAEIRVTPEMLRVVDVPGFQGAALSRDALHVVPDRLLFWWIEEHPRSNPRITHRWEPIVLPP